MMIARIDPATTPNGSGLTDFEIETELLTKPYRDLPKINPPHAVFQPGDRCWCIVPGGCFEARVTGLRCAALWVDGDQGEPQLMQPEWEYEVTAVWELRNRPFPESHGWRKAADLCSVKPQ